MAIYATPKQVADAAYAAGFRGMDLVIAIAVGRAESNHQIDLIYGPNPNGTYDYGEWQINQIHQPTAQDWKNLSVNAKMAKTIFDRRATYDTTGWNAWTTYRVTRTGEAMPRCFRYVYDSFLVAQQYGYIRSVTAGCDLKVV